MKKLLIVCGAGHATSTVARMKVQEWLKNENIADKVQVYQSAVGDEIKNISEDKYDAVISTTIVPDYIKEKVINGVPLMTGMGIQNMYGELKKRLNL
ncbi:PTS sugar transporter subunit IIB [Heyndrickxia acidiproducens]|uniref:PTS sugar transporter subunit IIB n=1 Tax=Heyndrickxia acidiproducens TaxID=1121084 RepID=UPI0003715D81|nr:PTS sugar transporter subunit IIB [Heyndrickxia acidiproducens]